MTREGQSNWSLLTGEPDNTAAVEGREDAGVSVYAVGRYLVDDAAKWWGTPSPAMRKSRDEKKID